MKYLMPCACGECFPISTSQAGARVLCPSCGVRLDVPALRQLQELRPVDQPGRRLQPPRWDARRAWMFFGFLLTLTAVFFLAFLWWRRPTKPDPRQLTLLDSWSVWMELRQGLDNRVSPYTYYMIETLRTLRVQSYFCLATAAVGLAITAAAFLSRKSRVRGTLPPG